jgi:pyrroloquinoline-quinone synthase
VKPQSVIRQLDDLIAGRSILGHPFYQAWRHGTLTRDQLATYAATYYPHVAAFPGYLETAAAGARDPQVRAELERNLLDERHHPKAHNELWLDFAAAMGADRRAVETAPPRPAARATVATFTALTGRGTAEALAALYAYESQQPDVSREKADGLRSRYGVTDPQALAYFTVHAETDLEHRAGERAALERCLAQGASADAVLDSARAALDAYWGLLDGVCEEAAVPTTC